MTTDEYRLRAAAASPARARGADLVRPRARLAASRPRRARSSRRSPAPGPRRTPTPRCPTEPSRLMMNRFAWGFDRETCGRHAQGRRARCSGSSSSSRPNDDRATTAGERLRRLVPRPDAAAPRPSGTTVFAGRKGSWEYAVDLANWSLLRRSHSKRQLLEVMVDFWSNHFHVPSTHDLAWSWRNHYDATMRRHALGTFDELLLAASLHPAMLLYLSNYESTKYARTRTRAASCSSCTRSAATPATPRRWSRTPRGS